MLQWISSSFFGNIMPIHHIINRLVVGKKLFKRRHGLNDYEMKARMCQWVQTLSPGTFFVGIKQVVYQWKNVPVSLVITATAGRRGLYFLFS
jgi:hypothetical protein